jgi:hypothetical protein
MDIPICGIDGSCQALGDVGRWVAIVLLEKHLDRFGAGYVSGGKSSHPVGHGVEVALGPRHGRG